MKFSITSLFSAISKFRDSRRMHNVFNLYFKFSFYWISSFKVWEGNFKSCLCRQSNKSLKIHQTFRFQLRFDFYERAIFLRNMFFNLSPAHGLTLWDFPCDWWRQGRSRFGDVTRILQRPNKGARSRMELPAIKHSWLPIARLWRNTCTWVDERNEIGINVKRFVRTREIWRAKSPNSFG